MDLIDSALMTRSIAIRQLSCQKASSHQKEHMLTAACAYRSLNKASTRF